MTTKPLTITTGYDTQKMVIVVLFAIAIAFLSPVFWSSINELTNHLA